MNKITMTLNVDHLIKEALQEDISSEDVTTNAVQTGWSSCRAGCISQSI